MTERNQTTQPIAAANQAPQSSEKKVWLVTGAGRGLGVDIAKAALAAGNAVVATARSAESITHALGRRDDLLAVALDVTDPRAAEAAVGTVAIVTGASSGIGHATALELAAHGAVAHEFDALQ